MITDAQKAAAEAAATLKPHRADQGIATLIETLQKIAVGDGDSESELEKAMAEMQTHRVAIAKADGISKTERFALTQRVDTSARELEHAFMLQKSAGYRRSAAQREAERSRRAASMGRRV